MARYTGDEYDAYRDEMYVPTPRRREVVEQPIYRERMPKEGEDEDWSPKRLRCSCGACIECVGW